MRRRCVGLKTNEKWEGLCMTYMMGRNGPPFSFSLDLMLNVPLLLSFDGKQTK
jgi:hypothetical protein